MAVGKTRLELAYCQFSAVVLEIPATFEYIDFEEPPDRLRITKIGGYITEHDRTTEGLPVQLHPITRGLGMLLF